MNRQESRINRIRRVLVKGTAERPRVSIEKSNRHLGWQLIDDSSGKTLAQATSKTLKSKEIATELGKQLAQAADKLGVKTVVFDRRGFKYHGQIAELAAVARENGLSF
ncbi:50S ribosomal protein L18 [Candidatus Berkelbacteria bacterium]|nr:50S ribosomal protein L18 [Candidatus Berkelbacteria bacterium]